MTDYRNIGSPFLRTLIAQTSWANRGYVDDLIALDRLIDCRHAGFAGAIHRRYLEGRYPAEYLALLRERGVERYQRGLEELNSRRSRARELQIRTREENRRAREEWLKIGGKP